MTLDHSIISSFSITTFDKTNYDLYINRLQTASFVYFDSLDFFFQKVFIINDIVCVLIYVIVDIIMFKFIEYHMNALNHNRNVVHFIDFQISEIFRDFVSSVLQFDHFADEIENFLVARTLDVQHDVNVRQRFVFVISNV